MFTVVPRFKSFASRDRIREKPIDSRPTFCSNTRIRLEVPGLQTCRTASRPLQTARRREHCATRVFRTGSCIPIRVYAYINVRLLHRRATIAYFLYSCLTASIPAAEAFYDEFLRFPLRLECPVTRCKHYYRYIMYDTHNNLLYVYLWCSHVPCARAQIGITHAHTPGHR